jgi:hypothetical protein
MKTRSHIEFSGGHVAATFDAATIWLATNWDSAVIGAPLTVQLRERYGLEFSEAVKVIAEARRRRATR